MVDANTSYKSNRGNTSQIDRLNRLTDKLNNVYRLFKCIEHNGLTKELKV